MTIPASDWLTYDGCCCVTRTREVHRKSIDKVVKSVVPVSIQRCRHEQHDQSSVFLFSMYKCPYLRRISCFASTFTHLFSARTQDPTIMEARRPLILDWLVRCC